MVPASDPTAPVIPSAEELYNTIMSEIEPELTTEGVKLLSEKYKNETTEEARTRKARYDKAYAEYDKQFAKHMDNINAKVKKYERASFAEMESEDRNQESVGLAEIENAFS